MHMIICCGRVVSRRRGAAAAIDSASLIDRCSVCKNEIEKDGPMLSCIHKSCTMRAHVVCLAGEFLKREPESILPVEGTCPGCQKRMLWGDLIRRLNGSIDLVEASPSEEDDVEVSDVSSVDEDN